MIGLDLLGADESVGFNPWAGLAAGLLKGGAGIAEAFGGKRPEGGGGAAESERLRAEAEARARAEEERRKAEEKSKFYRNLALGAIGVAVVGGGVYLIARR